MAATTAQSNAINIHVFRNGDSHYKGRKFVVNHKQTRNFDSFLSMVTTGVRPQNGAVRKLYTPTHGHKVDDLSRLENNKFYVAAGTERFRRVQYFSIGRPDGQRQVSILQRSVKPVAHSRIKVSAKIRKPADGPKTIHVFRNGDTLYPSVRLLLTKRMLSNWDVVLQVVTDRVNLINGAVRKLWHMDGSKVMELSEIESEGSYVASGQERFKKVAYGINGPLEPSSPRIKRPAPPKQKPVISRKPTKVPPKVTPPRKVPKKPAQPKPERKKKKEKTAEQKEAETVFLSKPSIVKRSREKDVLDFGEGEAGVFKAKEGRRETRGASEVQDTQETAVDLPIDQVTAEEVDDEADREDADPPPVPDEDEKDDSFGGNAFSGAKEDLQGPPDSRRSAEEIENNNNNSNLFEEKSEPTREKSDLVEENNNEDTVKEDKDIVGENDDDDVRGNGEITFEPKNTELFEERVEEEIAEEVVEEGEVVGSSEKVGEEVIDREKSLTAEEQNVNQNGNNSTVASPVDREDGVPGEHQTSVTKERHFSRKNTDNSNVAVQDYNQEVIPNKRQSPELDGTVVDDQRGDAGEDGNEDGRGEETKVEHEIEEYEEIETIEDVPILGEEYANVIEDEGDDVNENVDLDDKLLKEGDEIIIEDVPILGEDSGSVQDETEAGEEEGGWEDKLEKEGDEVITEDVPILGEDSAVDESREALTFNVEEKDQNW